MSTTRETLSEWFDRGTQQKATHMIVVCDTFDHEDYPVYVMPGQDAAKIAAEYSKDMQRVMEVYKMSIDKATQLNARRVYNL